jgi:hypothetical protein
MLGLFIARQSEPRSRSFLRPIGLPEGDAGPKIRV